jgi:hypothetical protein
VKISSIWFSVVAALALVADSSFLGSQQPAGSASKSAPKPAARSSQIIGIVVDSLHGGPLANAEVLAEGNTVAIAHTDSIGGFSIKGIQPGEYRVAVSHPLLDTLGISLVSPDFRVGSDSVSIVRLAVPSTSALISLKCGRSFGIGGRSAVIGRIVSPDSLTPIPKVEVTLSWTTYEVSKLAVVAKTPHVQRDTTSAGGAYRICGLPNDLEANLEARVGGELRSGSPITIPDSGSVLVVRNLVLPVSATARGETALISGTVKLPNDKPARGSSVEVVGTGRKTIVDEQGKFALDSVPVGTQTIQVRQLGYQEATIVMDVAPFAGQRTVVVLKEIVPVLASVNVTATARERALSRVGFSLRSQHSDGHFLTADQIAAKSDFRFTDLLRGIPGIRVGVDKHGDDVVTSPRAGGSLLNETHGCVQYFVDGQPWGNGALEAMGTAEDTEIAKMRARMAIETARQINASLQKSDIIGIEVYQVGGAPTYFNQGGHNCATIVIWTKAILGM